MIYLIINATAPSIFKKRGLKNIYEKLCLYYTSILSSFNILFLNISKEIINKCEGIIISHILPDMLLLYSCCISLL